MMPIGFLMKEHRLIERMIKIMKTQAETIRQENKADPAFIDTVIDFVRIYADKCHHGKEEDILFRDLANKKISEEHRRIMDELIEEHKMGRDNVKALARAKAQYVQGDKNALQDIAANLEMLAKFYPAHIAKEDKHFFFPCMDYFTKEEKDKMLDEMKEYDRNMIHVKYTDLVMEHEKK